MLKFKLKILFFLILIIATNCIAQELPPPYTPVNWLSLKELPDRLVDTTNYIGRFYQYSDLELYFKDSNNRLQKISDKEVYHPECYGAVGDGTTDDTAAFVDLAADLPADAVINLMNKTYYFNTSGGVTFSNRVNIIGSGKIVIGSGVGNNPAITIAGARSYLSDFEIVGDHTNFTNANLSTELRRNIKITADYVTCERLKDTNSIVGIELNAADHCNIINCISINDIIYAGQNQNNYNVGFYINGSKYCKIINNKISGHGNPVLHGGSSYYNMISNNHIYRADNNGIYVSSGQWIKICGNIIRECDGNGIKARDSYHLISNNLVDQNSWAGGLIGIGVTGNGTPDADGFNGEGTLVIGNIVRGQFTAGIRMSDQDNGYLKNPIFVNNVIEMTDDPNLSLYGIHVKGRSINSIIKGNTIKNAVYGIHYTVDDPNTDFHREALIANNQIYDSITYGILAVKTTGSSIIGNFINGATGSTLGIYTSSWNDSVGSEEILSIQNNHVKGAFASGIYVYAEDNHFLERVNIDNNEVEIQSDSGNGIRVLDATQNMKITGNKTTGHTIGIYISVQDPNTEAHTGMLIANNDTSGGNNDGIVLSNVNDSLITGNISINAAANRSGITLADCLRNYVTNNSVGDDQGTATQKFGIEEQGTSDYNIFIDNDCEGTVTYRYVITGDSSIVKTEQMAIETLSGNRTFEIGEAKTFVIDPGGAARNFNPRTVTWPMINELILINTADNAETITFDSAGLNQAVQQNERGIFVYDGSSWLKIYVGS